LHRRHILVDGKKMSKSLGNFFTIRDLLEKGYSGAEIRYALLSAHYRQQFNFTFDGLEGVRESLRRLREFLRNMADLPDDGPLSGELEARAARADAGFRAAFEDDLNTSAAFAEVFNFVRDANKLARSRADGQCARDQLMAWDRVFGVLEHSLRPAPHGLGPLDGGDRAEAGAGLDAAEIDRLLEARQAARARRDFAEADRVRDVLKDAGILIKDTPQGPKWFRESDL
jgi:cysteinyl-tRNA synthetase